MADALKGAAFLDAQAAKRPVVRRLRDIRGEIEGVWDAGLPPGDKTGWPSVDRYYTVVPGQVTVVTGWPSSGKSEWLDAMLIHLAHQGWKVAMFSPENQPLAIHGTKLLEKEAGKPFGPGLTPRIARDDLPEYIDALSESFGHIEHPGGEGLTIKSVVEAAQGFLDTYPESNRGLVIDPWNELEHWRPPNLSETEYISQTLSFVRNWARANRVHVWIVAHPQKMRRDDGGKLPVPRLDMISGSQHWWNKADCGITVYRDLSDPDNQEIEIYILKCRFKHVGRTGTVALHYDRVTGRYSEPMRDIYAVGR